MLPAHKQPFTWHLHVYNGNFIIKIIQSMLLLDFKFVSIITYYKVKRLNDTIHFLYSI